MNPNALFSKWAELAGITDQPVRSEEDLAYVFQNFSDRPEGLDALFAGMNAGEEVSARLKAVFTASETDAASAYFLVEHPPPLTVEQALALLQQHLNNLSAMSRATGAGLDEVLDGMSVRRAQQKTDIAQRTGDNPAAWLYDLVFDFTGTLKPCDEEATLLEEAFYSIANDIYLKGYLMWPFYAKESDLEDPFAPYFELWRHGVDIGFRGEDECLVYVPNPQ